MPNYEAWHEPLQLRLSIGSQRFADDLPKQESVVGRGDTRLRATWRFSGIAIVLRAEENVGVFVGVKRDHGALRD